MNNGILSSVVFAAILNLGGNVFAAEPSECTKAPKSAWIKTEVFEKDLKARYGATHDVKKLKIHGNCYEMYAIEKATKSKVELFFDPTVEPSKQEPIK
jgi:hypothetical protein